MTSTPDASVADMTDRTRSAILYLAHDLDDSAIWRRVAMLDRGGADVEVVGFRRGTGPVGGKTGGRAAALARDLGQTRNGQFAKRLALVARIGLATLFGRGLAGVSPPDLILARNLEMLALGMLLRLRLGAVPVVYELLDVHRIMLGATLKSWLVRAAERAMLRRSALVIVSSDGFTDNYLTPVQGGGAPTLLIENKPLAFLLLHTTDKARAPVARLPLVIGWFGILRCAWSLDCLDRLTRANAGRFRVVLRGKPALDVLPRFHETVAANPDLQFDGPYAWPEDLAQIYGGVHLAWLIDRYDAGANSDWLLPNRLYEGAAHGAVPVVLKATAVADRVARAGFGIEVMFPRLDAVQERLLGVTDHDLDRARASLAALPRSTWVAEDTECAGIVARLGALASAPAPRSAGARP
jgi:hypothetical protein